MCEFSTNDVHQLFTMDTCTQLFKNSYMTKSWCATFSLQQVDTILFHVLCSIGSRFQSPQRRQSFWFQKGRSWALSASFYLAAPFTAPGLCTVVRSSHRIWFVVLSSPSFTFVLYSSPSRSVLPSGTLERSCVQRRASPATPRYRHLQVSFQKLVQFGGANCKKALKKDSNENFEVRVVERIDH